MTDEEIQKSIKALDADIADKQRQKAELLQQTKAKRDARCLREYIDNLTHPFRVIYHDRNGDPLYTPYWLMMYGSYRLLRISEDAMDEEMLLKTFQEQEKETRKLLEEHRLFLEKEALKTKDDK